MRVSDVVRLLRPKQWSKNLLVFAALLFSGKLGDRHADLLALIAFIAMCLMSSALYMANDALDAPQDRLHEKKRDRPIAAGRIPAMAAWIVAPLLAAWALYLAWTVNLACGQTVLAYFVLQALYNAAFKRLAVADVFSIALGFVLRAVVGAAAISVPISGWLLFCTGALALMLGFGKRRAELMQAGEEASATRESLAHYRLQAIEAMLIVSAGSAAMSFGVYSIDSSTARHYPALILTSLFVFYGIYRYLFLVFAQNRGDEPEALIADPHILTVLVLFVVAAALAVGGWHVPFLDSPIQ